MLLGNNNNDFSQLSLAQDSFCMRLPKVELHAHINGSISAETMQVLIEHKKETHPELADYQIPKGLEKIEQFFPLFDIIYKVVDNEECVAIATRRIIDEFERDGVHYIELRTTPRSNKETNMTKSSYLETVLSVINEPRTSIIVRLLVSIDRRNTIEEAHEAIDLALRYRSQGVVGMDLCGETNARSFLYFVPVFDRVKKNNLKITLHFAETEYNIPESVDGLSIMPDRLGHATFLDDKTRKEVYTKEIPVEVCMTSNLLCKTSKSYEEHHIKELITDKHPFSLCTDDKGVFFSDLSREYAIAQKVFGLSNAELYEMSYRSIDMIFDADVKDSLRKTWSQWKEDNIFFFKNDDESISTNKV
ncbi:hypothetical protein BDF14DRAFT_1759716 [Spinellus fusiger]|nr:hypothetical protein BDF14DRAFT_1759716 [Spinellus fusiger]